MPNWFKITNSGSVYSVFVLVGLMVVLLALLTLVATFVFKETQQYRNDSCALSFSTPCKYLSMHPDDDYVTFQRQRNTWIFSVNEQGEYICTTNNLTNIVDKDLHHLSIFRVATIIWLDNQET